MVFCFQAAFGAVFNRVLIGRLKMEWFYGTALSVKCCAACFRSDNGLEVVLFPLRIVVGFAAVVAFCPIETVFAAVCNFHCPMINGFVHDVVQAVGRVQLFVGKDMAVEMRLADALFGAFGGEAQVVGHDAEHQHQVVAFVEGFCCARIGVGDFNAVFFVGERAVGLCGRADAVDDGVNNVFEVIRRPLTVVAGQVSGVALCGVVIAVNGLHGEAVFAAEGGEAGDWRISRSARSGAMRR